jgi:ribosomal protein S6
MTGEEIKTIFEDVEKNILKMGGEKLETLLDHPFLTKAETSKEEGSEELKNLPIVKRKMAYYVKKNKVGFYCLFNFSSEPENVKEIENYLRMNKEILRHIIIQADPMSKEEIKKLEKLFARKRAEQEKEKDKEKIKAKVKTKEETKIKKEVKEPQELKTDKITEKKIVEPKKELGEIKDKNVKEDTKKKKVKLEDLEDKLDEILEDTII